MTEKDLNKERDIELRSEDFQEVLGAIPPWILRWGITVIFSLIIIFLIGSWFIKYPDIITSTMTLTGSTPPIEIVAKTSGRLVQMDVEDNQAVKVGDYLAILENPALSEDMFELKNALENLIRYPHTVFSFSCRDMQLGSVQASYSSFYYALNNYRRFIELEYYPNKIASIEKRIQEYEYYYQNISEQKKISQEQYSIAINRFKRDSLLNEKNVLSREEFDDARDQYLQSRLSLQSVFSNLESLQLQISQMKESLLDIQQQYEENKSTIEIELNTYCIQLMNEINTWEMNYVLMSPLEGVITFSNYWNENQYVIAGETVFTVVPGNENVLMGRALLPIDRSGKVKEGQQVNIRFLNYPDNEFGMVKGIVKNISLVPDKQGNYTVEISLPNGLQTTYRQELPFSQEMKATADIITTDLRLLERFFFPIKKLISESFNCH